MIRAKYLILLILFVAPPIYSDTGWPNSDLRAYSLLSRLNALVDLSGNVTDYPVCVYSERTGAALSPEMEQQILDRLEWGINQWVSGVYGENGYEGFLVQNVSLKIEARSLVACDALSDNPLPFRRLTELAPPDTGLCGGAMIKNSFRCSPGQSNSTILHEIGHIIGFIHEFSYYDSDADHPLGPASVMNYDHFRLLPNITDYDIEMAKWSWKKSQNDLDAQCDNGQVHLSHQCVPAYFGTEDNVESEIRLGDKCLDLNGNDVVNSSCNGEQLWEFEYSNLQNGYLIKRNGRCLGIDMLVNSNLEAASLQTYDSLDCEMSLRSIWGIRQWGSKVQIQNSISFFNVTTLGSNGCLTMADTPTPGKCGAWDNDASPMFKTTDNTVFELLAITAEVNNDNDNDNDNENENENDSGSFSLGILVIMLGLLFGVWFRRKNLKN